MLTSKTPLPSLVIHTPAVEVSQVLKSPNRHAPLALGAGWQGRVRQTEGGIKPSLQVVNDPEGPHMIGRESTSPNVVWLDLMHVSRQI